MDNFQPIETGTQQAGENNKILPLTLNDVNFEVGGMRLLKDLTLTLEAGTRTVILGPNGAGKSLFLRICHGLLRPTSGHITWHGSAGDTAARHQAMIFQRPVMLRRSVRANLAYVLKGRGQSQAERRSLVEEMLQKAGQGAPTAGGSPTDGKPIVINVHVGQKKIDQIVIDALNSPTYVPMA